MKKCFQPYNSLRKTKVLQNTLREMEFSIYRKIRNEISMKMHLERKRSSLRDF